MSSIRSGMRPMSANPPSQKRQLITNTLTHKASSSAVDSVAKVWTAFGKYIEKELKNGKGVGIPKFGQFTFTPINVDLAGSTNPDKRDLQIREPIFQVAKDFVLGMEIKAGIVHENGVIRPFEIKGTSGIVPKVKINYTEIGYYAGCSKEEAKHGCDIVIRDLSDKVKSGQQAKLLIPHIGAFLCKNKIAGVKFSSDVIEESKGKTNKTHFIGKLFSSSVNRANLDLLDQKVSEGIRTKIAHLDQSRQRAPIVAKRDNTITVTQDAEKWMNRNLGVILEKQPSNMKSSASKNKMKRTYSARPGFRTAQSDHHMSMRSEQSYGDNFPKAPEEKAFIIKSRSKRPMSAYSGGSRMSRGSNRSSASVVPKITRATALNYCQRIATKTLLDYVQSSGISARDKLTPSELQSILNN